MTLVSNKVGIGTTAPTQLLDVRGVINASGDIYFNNGTKVGLGNISGGGTSGYIPQWSGTSTLNNSGIYYAGGRVGIGTTAPSNKLHIIDGNNPNPLHVSSGTYNQIALFNSTDDTSIINIIDDDNNMSFGINGDVFSIDTNSLTFGTPKLSIDISGNVGIGTTTPSNKLDVRGVINASGMIYYNNGTAVNLGTGNVSGGGAAGYIPQWANATSLNNSIIYQLGWKVGVGTTTPRQALDVNGSITGGLVNQSFKNIMSNGGGESGGFDGWGTVSSYGSITSSEKKEGTYGIAIISPNSYCNNYIYQDIPVKNNTYYSMTGWIKTNAAGGVNDAGGGYAKLWITNTTWGDGGSSLNFANVNNWTYDKIENYHSGNNNVLRFGVSVQHCGYHVTNNPTGGPGGSFYFDNIMVVEGPAAISFNEKYIGDSGNQSIFGKLGIGTMASSYALEINNNTKGLNVSNNLFVNATNVGIGTATPFTIGGTAILSIDNGGSNSMPFTYGDSSTDAIYLRRFGTGGYQFQTTSDGGNSGNLSLQTYGGRVGIGTASPGEELEVYGDILLPYSIGALKFKNTANGSSASIAQVSTYNSNELLINNPSDGPITLNAYVNGNINFRIAGTEKVRIDNVGRVGIGTTAPSYALEINNATKGLNVSNNLFVNASNVGIGTTNPLSTLELVSLRDGQLSNVSNQNLYLRTSSVSNIGSSIAFGVSTANRIGAKIVHIRTDGESTGDLAFYTRNDTTSTEDSTTEKMRITKVGNVGIGTTAPSAKLEINGTGALLNVTSGSTPVLFANSSGNVGIATSTPDSNYFLNVKAGQNNSGALIGLVSIGSSATGYGIIGDNLIFTDVSSRYLYNRNDLAAAIDFGNGDIAFKTAVTGTAGNIISFSTPMHIENTNGNVGIGTAVPSNKLDVRGVINASGMIYYNNGTAVNTGWGNVSGGGAAGYIPQWANATSLNNSMIYQLGGNVGINTTAPTAPLHIKGGNAGTNFVQTILLEHTGDEASLKFSSSNYGIKLKQPGDTNYIQFAKSDTLSNVIMHLEGGGRVGINTTAPNYLLELNALDKTLNVSNNLFVNASNVGIGTSTPLSRLHINGGTGTLATGLTFGDGDSGLYESADDTLKFNVSGVDTIVMNSAQRVGIGTSTLSSVLNIGGDQIVLFTSGGTIQNLNSLQPPSGVAGTLTINAGSVRLPEDVGGDGYRLNIVNGSTGAIAIKLSGSSKAMSIRNASNAETMGMTLTGFTQAGAGNGNSRFSFDHTVAPASATGDGVGLTLATEDANGNLADVGYIDAVYDNITLDDVSMRFSVRNSATPIERMRIDPNGNVGIGTTTPSNKLDVRGVINASSDIYFNNGTKVGLGNLSGGGTSGYLAQW